MNWADKHFPSDAKSWKDSTDELGSLVHELHYQTAGSKMDRITHPTDTPAMRNQKLKEALVKVLKKADEETVRSAADHFPSILKESTSTSSSGPDKWTRDERGRFA